MAPRVNSGSASRYKSDLLFSAASYLTPRPPNADATHSAEYLSPVTELRPNCLRTAAYSGAGSSGYVNG
jgi:hypothetical protein